MARVNVGLGSCVSSERLGSVRSPDSAPIKRMVQDARERGNLIDASYGRKTRSILVTDGGYIILSALTSEAMAERLGYNVQGGYEDEAT